MARTETRSEEEMRSALFALVREQKDAIVNVVVQDTAIEAQYLGPAFERVLDLVAVPVPSTEQIASWRERGMELAREGAAPERVLDAFLSLNWAIWEAVMGAEHIERSIILDFADRLLRGLDDAIAAISEGYMRVEVELASDHSQRRRAVLEEILAAPRETPQDRARIRLRAERHGLSVAETYRLILIHVAPEDEDEVERFVDELERRIRVPSSDHRITPGIRLPVVLDWRGRVLVFAAADWPGERRLRDALEPVVGDRYVAIDTGPVEGIEPLSDALGEAEYSATVAEALGRHGWIGDPTELALESTFLLDAPLAQAVVDKELGPLLADPRMGQELIATLEVFLGSRQNIRETARRLHLAPRTVAYRLERIETLLGHDLEGEAAVRVSAALMALRVSQQVGRLAQTETE
jgi:hypothetical protein